jgi:hypothetical protein
MVSQLSNFLLHLLVAFLSVSKFQMYATTTPKTSCRLQRRISRCHHCCHKATDLALPYSVLVYLQSSHQPTTFHHQQAAVDLCIIAWYYLLRFEE